jgi:hypothetical protein
MAGGGVGTLLVRRTQSAESNNSSYAERIASLEASVKSVDTLKELLEANKTKVCLRRGGGVVVLEVPACPSTPPERARAVTPCSPPPLQILRGIILGGFPRVRGVFSSLCAPYPRAHALFAVGLLTCCRRCEPSCCAGCARVSRVHQKLSHVQRT